MLTNCFSVFSQGKKVLALVYNCFVLVYFLGSSTIHDVVHTRGHLCFGIEKVALQNAMHYELTDTQSFPFGFYLKEFNG